MLGKILSVGIFGIDGYMVEVEFDVRGGMPAVVVVGPPGSGKTVYAGLSPYRRPSGVMLL